MKNGTKKVVKLYINSENPLTQGASKIALGSVYRIDKYNPKARKLAQYSPYELSEVNSLINDKHQYLIVQGDKHWQAYNLELTPDSLLMRIVKGTDLLEYEIMGIDNRGSKRLKTDEIWFQNVVKLYVDSEIILGDGDD